MATLKLPSGKTISFPDGLTEDEVSSIYEAASTEAPAESEAAPTPPPPPNEAIPVTPRMRALSAEPPKKPDRSQAFTPTGEPADPFADESTWSTTKRRGQQFTTAATDMVASVPEDLAIKSRMLDRNKVAAGKAAQAAIPKEQAELEKIISDNEDKAKRGDFEATVRVRAARMRLKALEGQAQQADTMTADAEASAAVPLKDSFGFKTADAIRGSVESVVGKPDPRDQSFSGKVASGAGGMAGFVVATMLGNAAAGPIGGAAAGATLGSMASEAEMYKAAIAAGATEEEAEAAGRWGALIGSAEVVPILTALKYVPPAFKLKVGNIIAKKVAEIAESSGEEFAQEYLSTVAKNLTGFEDKPWNEGALESGIIGAVLGGGVGTIGAATGGNEPKVQPVSEKGPDSAQQEALNATDKPPVDPVPKTTATATVTPAEPAKSGVTVGETAPDVTAAVTAASNPTPPSAPVAPQPPGEGAAPGAKAEFIKQMAAFREMERRQREGEQAQATPNTGAPPVPPDTAQAPEGPQVGGAPAAPTTPPNALLEAQKMIADQGFQLTPENQQALAAEYSQIDQQAPDFQEQMQALVQKYVDAGAQVATPAPSAAAEALQGLDAAGAPAAPAETAPITEAPSPAAQASADLPPVEAGAAETPEVTSEVTSPTEEEASEEKPKERKYSVVRQTDVLLDAGIPEEQYEAMPAKRRAQLAKDIRAKAERMAGENLHWMDPAERADVVSKAWAELQRLRAAAKPAERPAKAAAAVAVSKAKSKEAKAAVTDEAAAQKEAERKAKIEAHMEEQRQKLAAEQATQQTAQEAAPQPGKPRVLKDTSEAGLRKAAEAKIATDERDQAISAQNAEADAKAEAAAAAPAEEKPQVNNKIGAAERVRRVANKRTADDIIARDEHNTSQREDKFEGNSPVAEAARNTIVNRAKRMVAAAQKLMSPDAEGKVVPSKLYMSADEDLAPNAATMLLHEAQRLANKQNPTVKDVTEFRTNEVLLRAGMVSEYLKSRKVEGDVASKAQPTATNKSGETTDAVDRAEAPTLSPEKALEEKQAAEEELTTDIETPPAPPPRTFTSESNPGYVVGAKKAGEVKTEKKRKISKEEIAQRAKTIPKKIAEKEAADPAKPGKPSDPNVAMTASPPGWSFTGDAKATSKPIKTWEEVYFINNNFGPFNAELTASLRRLLKMVLGLDPWVAKNATDYDSFSNMLGRLTDEQMASAMQSDRLWDESRGARDPQITKMIIERMNSVIGDVGVYVVRDSAMDLYNPNAGAFYSPQYDLIVIRESAFTNTEKFLHDLIHEGAHAALWAAVRKNPVARRQLAQMAAVYNETLEVNNSDKPYSATNLDEFMSELLSNPNTKNVLSDIQMDDIEFEAIGVPAPKGKLANAWNYLKALVAKAFGFADSNDMSIYARAMDVIDQLLNEASVARKEWKNLLGDKAMAKWQEKQETEYKEFASKLPENGLDNTAPKRERYEDLGRTTKNKYPPNLNSENSGKTRRQSNWHKMVSGGVDQKTAKEINDWLKSEEGKSVDPATVDLLIQDAIEAFGKKKSEGTSESNDGGMQPPYTEPPSPGMGPADPIEPQPESFRGKDRMWVRRLKRTALYNMTLDFIRQKYTDKLKDSKGSIVKAMVEAVQRRDNIASEFAEPINKITAEFTDLMRTNRDEAIELAELASEATRLDIRLGVPSANRGNGAKFLQGKAREAALNERFKNNLSDRGRSIYRRLTAAYRDAHNANVEALVYNILSRMETKLSTGDVMYLMKKVTEGKLDANDEAMINDPILFNGLKNAQGLKTIVGDYFPQMRFGDWVVTTKEKLVDPDWKTVQMKVTVPPRQKILPNGKVVTTKGSVRVTDIPVKTEVDGNAVRVIVDPTVRGAMTAAKRKLRDYASKHDLTLLGISTMYRDRKTGKLVSKGNQLIDREYDTVYEARFQTDGVQFFENEKDAYKFKNKLSNSDVTSEVKTRKQLDETSLPDGSVLGTIVNRINSDKRLSPGEKKLFDNVVKNAIIASMDGNSARSRYQARRNVRGASKDLARAAVTYGQAAGNFHATLQTAPDIRDAMERLEAFASATGNKEGGGEISDVAQVLRDRMATIEGAGEPIRIARTLATIAYMDKLGTLSHSIINGLQPAGTTMPVLAGRYGGGRAALALGKAYAKIGAGGIVGSGFANTGRAIKGALRTNIDTTDVIGSVRENLRKEYGVEYDALIDRMLELGAVSPDAGQEVAGMVEADANGAVSKVIGRMDRTLRQMPNAVEAINRLVTAVATYDLAIKNNSNPKSKQDAIQEAIDTVFNTQGDYRKKNSPRWMQHPALSWAMQFQKYTQMMFQLTVDMGARAINGATPAERAIARKQLAYYYLTQAAMAGVYGLPGLQILKLGALALTTLGLAPWDDEEDELRKMVEDNANPTIASLINNGLLSTVTGMDFSTRLNQSDAGIGYLPTNISKEALQKYFGGLILGNPGGTGLDLVDAAKAFANGDIETGLEKSLMLKQVSDIIGAYKGVRDNKLTAKEAAGKVLGFRSLKTAQESRNIGVDIRAGERRKIEEKELRRRMVQALDRRDKKSEMKAMQDILAYNRELKKKDPKAKPMQSPASIRRYWIMDQRKLKNGS